MSLHSVRKANVTSNDKIDLTVYPAQICDIEDTVRDVESCLIAYFAGKSQLIEEPIIEDTKRSLIGYPEVKKLYDEALDKYKKGENSRNILDDMRLALEILLKRVLKNNKSIENQFSEIGKYIKEHGLSKELANMFDRLLNYYNKYQNTHIKHDNAVNDKEIDFIIQ
jgi:hypothetical protein